MKKLYQGKGRRVHPAPAPQAQADAAAAAVALPAAVLALASALTAEEQEVLAYLLSGGGDCEEDATSTKEADVSVEHHQACGFDGEEDGDYEGDGDDEEEEGDSMDGDADDETTLSESDCSSSSNAEKSTVGRLVRFIGEKIRRRKKTTKKVRSSYPVGRLEKEALELSSCTALRDQQAAARRGRGRLEKKRDVREEMLHLMATADVFDWHFGGRALLRRCKGKKKTRAMTTPQRGCRGRGPLYDGGISTSSIIGLHLLLRDLFSNSISILEDGIIGHSILE
uniref:Uncharacterized protein n=1 Tax=Oryza officinalis TaxID=4535 RepID=G9C3C0_9ORYZ|nr:hypothetical protein [Oryza officinalis]